MAKKKKTTKKKPVKKSAKKVAKKSTKKAAKKAAKKASKKVTKKKPVKKSAKKSTKKVTKKAVKKKPVKKSAKKLTKKKSKSLVGKLMKAVGGKAKKPTKKAAAKKVTKKTVAKKSAKKTTKKVEPTKKASKKSAASNAVEAPALEQEILIDEIEEQEEEEIILTDAEGNRICRVGECDQISQVDGYCRYHYLLFWKRIQARKKILSEGKLEKYIEDLTSRYPDKFLEILRKDLKSQKDFLHIIQELEIDEPEEDTGFEEDDQNYIDEIRGVEGATKSNRKDDDFS